MWFIILVKATEHCRSQGFVVPIPMDLGATNKNCMKIKLGLEGGYMPHAPL